MYEAVGLSEPEGLCLYTTVFEDNSACLQLAGMETEILLLLLLMLCLTSEGGFLGRPFIMVLADDGCFLGASFFFLCIWFGPLSLSLSDGVDA